MNIRDPKKHRPLSIVFGYVIIFGVVLGLLWISSIALIKNKSCCLIDISPPIQAIPGTYIGRSKFANEKLILFPDLRYEQNLIFKGTSKTRTLKGKWHYTDGLLGFDLNFIVPLDDKALLDPIHGTDGLPAEVVFGDTYLGLEENNERTFYKKQ